MRRLLTVIFPQPYARHELGLHLNGAGAVTVETAAGTNEPAAWERVRERDIAVDVPLAAQDQYWARRQLPTPVSAARWRVHLGTGVSARAITLWGAGPATAPEAVGGEVRKKFPVDRRPPMVNRACFECGEKREIAASSKPIDRNGSTSGDSSAERGPALARFPSKYGPRVRARRYFPTPCLTNSCRGRVTPARRRTASSRASRSTHRASLPLRFRISTEGENPSTSPQSRRTSNLGETADR